MIKARNKKLSMILVLAMLMTMFVGVGTASAAIVDYSAFGVTTVNTGTDFDKTLGSILVEIDDVVYLGAYENWVTLKMPSGVSIKDGSVTITDEKGLIATRLEYKNSSTVDIMVKRNDASSSTDDPRFVINFNNVKVQSGSGNLDVTFIPQGGSILPGGTVTVANIVSKGATQAVVSSVKSLGEGVGAIDTISIGELSPRAIEGTGKIKLELPAGVKWVKPKNVDEDLLDYLETNNKDEIEKRIGENVVVGGAWSFSNIAVLNSYQEIGTDEDGNPIKAYYPIELYTEKGDSILVVDIKQDLRSLIPASKDRAGRIDIGGAGLYLYIDIDEDDAKKGDIKVKISSKDFDGVTKQDLVIAKYGDFEVTLAENEVTELVAGKADQELGSFYIEEALAGSLVEGRTITLQLPSGVKWNEAPELTVEKGDIVTDVRSESDKKVRYTIKSISGNPSKILVEEGEVYVEPNFEGDVELEVSGTAGVRGTVKVAEAVKAVDISVSEVPNVIIGEQNVMAGDIIIKENAAEAIQEGDIVIELAGGYVFYKEPTVEVTEGDLRIDDVEINNDDQLVITIDKESNDASTITISDIYITGYRYAPTGPVVAKFVAAKGNTKDEEYTGSTALDSLYIAPNKGNPSDESKDNKYSEKSVGEVTIANCITPAEGAGVSSFKIGSNIYTLNGTTKVMDVAPYIKGDRTFMPVRFVAYAVGLNDDDIIWDEAAQKVTLTKDDVTVEMVIGSDTITVNGQAQAIDVAPEITNARTMLPARFVAEAFGYNVGWDPGTQTVLISK